MDIKDLEVRGIVRSGSINCSKLHPEKFYILKNPKVVATNLNTINMVVEVYNDMYTLLGEIDISNFVFGLNTVNTFFVLKPDGFWRSSMMSQFAAKGDPTFPDMGFHYQPGYRDENFEYNGVSYILHDLGPFFIKDDEKLELYRANRQVSHGFFEDPNGPNGPYFMIDPTYNPNM